jgi:ElaB/YqjD/DUF883 family membrane-anchored ribosome-binding protein
MNKANAMNTLTLIISLMSLALAATAYWRAGGKQGVERARLEIQRDIERLSATQKELAESVAQNIAAAYEASRERLEHAREVLRQTKDDAVQGLEQQIKRAQEHLDALAQRLEEGARSAKDATVIAARNAEQAIALRVRRIEARTMLLRAKAKASRAVGAAGKQEFERADELLKEATELLRTARTTLAEDHAYDQLFDTMKNSLREATTAVREHAQNVRQKIEQVLTDTDNLVRNLELDEQKASGQTTTSHLVEEWRAAA